MAISEIKVGLWYNLFIVSVLAMTVASLIFGLDVILNGISIVFAAGLTLTALIIIGLAVFALGWFTIRDGMGEIQMRRGAKKAWVWQVFAYLAVIGIFIDGTVGAWIALHEHATFAKAVRDIPFAGAPVLLALTIYPIKWIEQLFRQRFAHSQDALVGTLTDDNSLSPKPPD